MLMEIQAGAKLDLASPGEVRSIVDEAFRGWQVELARGTRYRRAGALPVATGAGALSLSPSDNIGPAEGMVWSVGRITVTGLTAAETITAYVNDTSALFAVFTFTATINAVFPSERGLMLNPGDRIVLSGAGLTAGKQYGVSVEACEVPVQLASRFL